MKLLRNNYQKILIVLFLFFSFNVKSFSFLDPDFGWHLRLGDYIFSYGIPKTDPFSYTMPHFPFIDHGWLTNILLAKLFPLLGVSGLSILICLLALLIIVVYTQNYPGKANLPLLLLLGGILTNFIGIRPQIFDWGFAAFIFFLFFSPKLWQKYRFFLPFLMLLWVNLHGGFAMGIFLLFLYFVSSVFFTKKAVFQDFLVLLFSLLATFINPYGPSIWIEVIRTISDTKLHQRIMEWMPSFFFFRPLLWIYFLISIVFVIKAIKKLPKQHLFFYFVLLILGLLSYRQMPFFLLYSFPLTILAISFFKKSVSTLKYAKKRLLIVYKLLFVLIIISWFVQYYSLLPVFKRPYFYPDKAILFLKKHPFEGELFAPYEWGGYLDWQYPEKKVFIDGRMPSWRGQSSFKNEANDAFFEYEKVVFKGERPIGEIITKYNISRVLFFKSLSYKQTKQTAYQKFQKLLPEWLRDKAIVVSALQKGLLESGMKKIYQDDVAVIYGR